MDESQMVDLCMLAIAKVCKEKGITDMPKEKIHAIIFDVAEELNLPITRSWYK